MSAQIFTNFAVEKEISMKQIGFKNFKRFKELGPLDLGKVTILVGANNSGKSTFLKSILLAHENIIHLPLTKKIEEEKATISTFEWPNFSFDLNKYDAGVSNFGRSHTKESDSCTISIQIGLPLVYKGKYKKLYIDDETLGFIINFRISSDDKKEAERSLGRIDYISIRDCYRHITYQVDFEMGYMSVQFTKPNIFYNKGKSNFQQHIDNSISSIKSDLEERLYVVSLPDETESESTLYVETKLQDYIVDNSTISKNSLSQLVENIGEYINCMLSSGEEDSVLSRYSNNKFYFFFNFKDNRTKREIEQIDKLRSFDGDIVSIIKASVDELNEVLKLEPVYIFIPIHSIKRSIFYNINDKNDFVAASIHRYMRSTTNRSKKKVMASFIRKWLKEFHIGIDFKIKSLEGEYYSFTVQTEEKGKSIYLADLGTGSIQLLILLLNVASGMASSLDSKGEHVTKNKPVSIIVEEPEQNLHPKFQSRLADLFFEASKYVNLIIETHSEYLIRRVQVLIAEQNFAENTLYDFPQLSEVYNPFIIYYFPEHGNPYNMGLHDDGWFEEKFGEGFLDEADKSHLAMLKMGGRRKV